MKIQMHNEDTNQIMLNFLFYFTIKSYNIVDIMYNICLYIRFLYDLKKLHIKDVIFFII